MSPKKLYQLIDQINREENQKQETVLAKHLANLKQHPDFDNYCRERKVHPLDCMFKHTVIVNGYGDTEIVMDVTRHEMPWSWLLHTGQDECIIERCKREAMPHKIIPYLRRVAQKRLTEEGLNSKEQIARWEEIARGQFPKFVRISFDA